MVVFMKLCTGVPARCSHKAAVAPLLPMAAIRSRRKPSRGWRSTAHPPSTTSHTRMRSVTPRSAPEAASFVLEVVRTLARRSSRHNAPWLIRHTLQVVKTLKHAIQTATLPHLLFYGPPGAERAPEPIVVDLRGRVKTCRAWLTGTGKTSTILAVARCLFGPEYR